MSARKVIALLAASIASVAEPESSTPVTSATVAVGVACDGGGATCGTGYVMQHDEEVVASFVVWKRTGEQFSCAYRATGAAAVRARAAGATAEFVPAAEPLTGCPGSLVRIACDAGPGSFTSRGVSTRLVRATRDLQASQGTWFATGEASCTVEVQGVVLVGTGRLSGYCGHEIGVARAERELATAEGIAAMAAPATGGGGRSSGWRALTGGGCSGTPLVCATVTIVEEALDSGAGTSRGEVVLRGEAGETTACAASALGAAGWTRIGRAGADADFANEAADGDCDDGAPIAIHCESGPGSVTARGFDVAVTRPGPEGVFHSTWLEVRGATCTLALGAAAPIAFTASYAEARNEYAGH